MSSVYDESTSGWAIFGRATKVPLPCRRCSRPSPTSSCRACRTVVREVEKSSARIRSDGTGVPGGWVRVISSR